MLKGERKWRKLRAGREHRIFLKMQPKARKQLKRRLHSHGRVGIRITCTCAPRRATAQSSGGS